MPSETETYLKNNQKTPIKYFVKFSGKCKKKHSHPGHSHDGHGFVLKFKKHPSSHLGILHWIAKETVIKKITNIF